MLKDKLIYYPRRSQIKIGAVDGSNYFYCGTVGDWLDRLPKYARALNIPKEEILAALPW